MLCAAGLIIISVQTHEDVLQSDSFSPSSVCTKCWSSGAACKSSAPPQSAAQLTTRDVKQSRRETRRCLRIKERNNRTTRWCKNPPKEAKRSKQSKTNKNKMTHNEYKQCFLWGRVLLHVGTEGPIVSLSVPMVTSRAYRGNHGTTWKWDSLKNTSNKVLTAVLQVLFRNTYDKKKQHCWLQPISSLEHSYTCSQSHADNKHIHGQNHTS